MSTIEPLADSDSESECIQDAEIPAKTPPSEPCEPLAACAMRAPYVVLLAGVLASSPVLVATVLALPDINLTYDNTAAFKAVVDTDSIALAVQFCRHPSFKQVYLAPLIDRAERQGHYHMAELLSAYK